MEDHWLKGTVQSAVNTRIMEDHWLKVTVQSIVLLWNILTSIRDTKRKIIHRINDTLHWDFITFWRIFYLCLQSFLGHVTTMSMSQ